MVCNGFYGKMYCGGILYSIVKYILVGLCLLCGKTFLRRYVYYGKNIKGGGAIVVRLPRSLLEADEKPLGRAHDRSEAAKKPLRGR